MAKTYEWSAALTVNSGGYEGEPITIKQGSTTIFSGSVDMADIPKTFAVGWAATSAPTGSAEYTYTYWDNDHYSSTPNVASEVQITLRESWSVSISSTNYLTVAIDSTLVRAERILHGSPTNANRHLWLRRTAGGADFAPFPLVDDANTAHVIASNVNLGTYTYTLAPGEDATGASVYWRNTSVGHESDPIPNIYTDIMYIGVHFKNTLPKDHRVGATLLSSTKHGDVQDGVWVNNNDTNGGCHVLSNVNNMTWKEMRNVGDGTNQGDPPLILKANNANSWYDQRALGKYVR